MLTAEAAASVAATPPPTAIDGDPGVNRDGWGVVLAMTLPDVILLLRMSAAVESAPAGRRAQLRWGLG